MEMTSKLDGPVLLLRGPDTFWKRQRDENVGLSIKAFHVSFCGFMTTSRQKSSSSSLTLSKLNFEKKGRGFYKVQCQLRNCSAANSMGMSASLVSTFLLTRKINCQGLHPSHWCCCQVLFRDKLLGSGVSILKALVIVWSLV